MPSSRSKLSTLTITSPYRWLGISASIASVEAGSTIPTDNAGGPSSVAVIEAATRPPTTSVTAIAVVMRKAFLREYTSLQAANPINPNPLTTWLPL